MESRDDVSATEDGAVGLVDRAAACGADDDAPRAGNSGRNRWRRRLVVGAAVLVGALGALYGLDLALTAGELPRGVSVAGVFVGGLSPPDAEQTLRTELEPRRRGPVQVTAGDIEKTFTPAAAGIRVDWAATLGRIGSQPLDPWTRLTSFFSERDHDVVTFGEGKEIGTVVETYRAAVDRDLVEGGIRFAGVTPVPVDPVTGRKLNVDQAKQVLRTGWARGNSVRLPVEVISPKATVDGVRVALEHVATPAVSGPVTVRGQGGEATLDRTDIAGALSFEPNADGGLAPKFDQAALTAKLSPRFSAGGTASQDGKVQFDSGRPAAPLAATEQVIDWPTTLAALLEAVKRTDNRVVDVAYRTSQTRLTAEDISRLGVKEVVGEFTTQGFAQDSGVNIRTVADKVNGAVIKPGETFSLNGYTGPRGAAQGYIEAGVIEEGVPAREVGGGISQFATTLYNAAYFGGMTDADHKEHSFYISRYPAAREATVFQNPDGSSVIDLKFKNDGPTGVAIQTVWTDSSITVRLWGTKGTNVESIPGPRTDYAQPKTITKAGSSCKSVKGTTGFVTSDTRVIRDLNGNEVSRSTRRVRYNPEPKIVCS